MTVQSKIKRRSYKTELKQAKLDIGELRGKLARYSVVPSWIVKLCSWLRCRK